MLCNPLGVGQGTLAQYAERLHRLHEGKREARGYDYADVRVGVLDRMYAKRVKGYAAMGYKVKSDAGLPETGNIIFDATNFLPVFAADVEAAKREVVVVSPFVTKSRVTAMLRMLGTAMVSGVKITVVTRPAGDCKPADQPRVEQLLAMMRGHGVNVVERAKIHQKFAVIDARTAWYGSINLLAYGNAEESVMRLESRGIAEELLGVVCKK